MSDDTALGGNPSLGTQHLVARAPTFGQLRGNQPETPDVPEPTYGGPFGNYSGHGSRSGSGGAVSAPGPSGWEAPPIASDVSFAQHGSQSHMPDLGGAGKAAEGAEEGAGATEAAAGGAAETAATGGLGEAAASIPEILGFL